MVIRRCGSKCQQLGVVGLWTGEMDERVCVCDMNSLCVREGKGAELSFLTPQRVLRSDFCCQCTPSLPHSNLLAKYHIYFNSSISQNG